MRKTLIVMLLLGGCAEVPPITAKVDVATLRLSKEQPAGDEKVGVALDLITPDQRDAHPELQIKASWHEKSDSMVHTGMVTQTSALKTVSARLPLLPLPAFVVRIINKGGAPVSFANAQFALRDDRGRTYSIYPDSSEIEGRLEADLMSTHPLAMSDNQLLEGLREVVARLPLLTRNTRVAVNSEFQGYLVFKLDAHDLAELHEWLGDVHRLTLSVTGVDGASPLVVQVERTVVPLTMSCQGDKPPSVKTCMLPPQGN
jgi:hypothetical protein